VTTPENREVGLPGEEEKGNSNKKTTYRERVRIVEGTLTFVWSSII